MPNALRIDEQKLWIAVRNAYRRAPGLGRSSAPVGKPALLDKSPHRVYVIGGDVRKDRCGAVYAQRIGCGMRSAGGQWEKS